MAVQSAGLLMVRSEQEQLQFFLVHPGGPFFAKKNEGVWSIPKGLIEEGELPPQTAEREFFEETGINPVPPFHSLGTVKLKSGKIIHAWSFAGTWNEDDGVKSNLINVEWPPRSGKMISIPEVDRGAWMDFEKAKVMIHSAQVPFLVRAIEIY